MTAVAKAVKVFKVITKGALKDSRIGPVGPKEISRWRQPPDRAINALAPAGGEGISAAPLGLGFLAINSGGFRHRLISGEPPAPKSVDDSPLIFLIWLSKALGFIRGSDQALGATETTRNMPISM